MCPFGCFLNDHGCAVVENTKFVIILVFLLYLNINQGTLLSPLAISQQLRFYPDFRIVIQSYASGSDMQDGVFGNGTDYPYRNAQYSNNNLFDRPGILPDLYEELVVHRSDICCKHFGILGCNNRLQPGFLHLTNGFFPLFLKLLYPYIFFSQFGFQFLELIRLHLFRRIQSGKPPLLHIQL